MRSKLIFEIIYIVLGLVEEAMAGNKKAQQRLKDILPPQPYTQLVKEAQDIEDLKKFGPRG